MGLFKKRIGGNLTVSLCRDNFTTSITLKADDVKNSLSVSSFIDFPAILVRDEKYWGVPHVYGGQIYPFSVDPTKKGSNAQKNKFTTATVCFLNDFIGKILWQISCPLQITSPKIQKKYQISARGTLFAKFDESDPDNNAKLFFHSIIAKNGDYSVTGEQLADILRPKIASEMEVIIKDYIEKYLAQEGTSLSDFEELRPSDILKLSEIFCNKISHVFPKYGLAIEALCSSGSALSSISLKELEN